MDQLHQQDFEFINLHNLVIILMQTYFSDQGLKLYREWSVLFQELYFETY